MHLMFSCHIIPLVNHFCFANNYHFFHDPIRCQGMIICIDWNRGAFKLAHRGIVQVYERGHLLQAILGKIVG